MITRRIGWTTATSFVEAIEANGGILGQMVRNLEGLVHWLVALEEIDDSARLLFSGPVHRDLSRAYAWLLDVLQACSALVKVDIVFSYSELSQTLEALKTSAATLKHVRCLDGLQVFKSVRGALPATSNDYFYFASINNILLALKALPFVDQFQVEDPTRSIATCLTAFQARAIPIYLGGDSTLWHKLRLHS